MSTQRFVRSAREEDVDTIVGIQVAAWRDTYGSVLPEEVLAELTGEEAGQQFRHQWSEAIRRPPTSRHRVLVATDERLVVGFAAIGPAGDDDLWPATDAEIYALHVHPEHVRRGHGARLLNATVDHLVDDGFHTVSTWTVAAPNALRSFVESSGWQPDGARREIDMGATVSMIRLRAAIGE
ncbi:GNAT family N-acetyltransferase [Salinactinospora qingdaonensis]